MSAATVSPVRLRAALGSPGCSSRFFAVVVAVNGAMIWLAMSSWTGLAANQSYDKGLQYNRNLAAAQRQAALGWRPRLAARLVAGDRAQRPSSLLHGCAGPARWPMPRSSVELERPTSEGADFRVALVPAGPGIYRAYVRAADARRLERPRHDPAPGTTCSCTSSG